MTCIAGYVDKVNKRVVIGADSAAVKGMDVTCRKDAKVFKNDDFVIGCTTSFRMIQLLRYSFAPPKIYDKDIYEYMCTEFINSIRKCFKDGGYLQKFDEGDEMGGTFLVGYKDRLFKIDNDFQVAESIRGYDACGCGKPYALGSMFSTSETDPQNIVSNALKCAEEFSGGVREPFRIFTT